MTSTGYGWGLAEANRNVMNEIIAQSFEEAKNENKIPYT